jgi:hypothetical protein
MVDEVHIREEFYCMQRSVDIIQETPREGKLDLFSKKQYYVEGECDYKNN